MMISHNYYPEDIFQKKAMPQKFLKDLCIFSHFFISDINNKTLISSFFLQEILRILGENPFFRNEP